MSWTKTEPSRSMRQEWPECRDLTIRWRRTADLLALIRNRIHGAPLQSVTSGNDFEVSMVLPRPVRIRFETLAGATAESADWGVRNYGMFDPWSLTEKAVMTTRESLRQIAQISTRVHVPDPNLVVWPWDEATAAAALRAMALDP